MPGTSWSVLQIVVAVVTVLTTSFLAFAWWRLTYWRRKGIHHIPPKLPFGNANDLLLGRKSFTDVMRDVYRQVSDKPYSGIYMALQPSLVVMDPILIKDVLIRSALSNFQHHIANADPDIDPVVANNVFMARGARWKTLRAGLSPSFSSGKMKMIYPLMVAKAKQLVATLEETAEGPDPKIDARLYAARYTTDVIASCAFGIETNSLKNPENQFFKMGLRIFERTLSHSLATTIIFQFSSLVKITRSVFVVKEVADFFRQVVWGVVKEREEKGTQRGDYLDMLIQLKNNGKVYEEGDDQTMKLDQHKDKDKISKHFDGDSLVAHAVVFYAAGYETSSTALNFALLELARNPHCQEKLIKEIDGTLEEHKGEISYDTLRSMPYLDKVINETLRKYPALAALDRYCTQEYRNPDFNLVIPKGMSVLVPIIGIHYDPRYYPDPEKFDPERFSEEAKNSRPSYAFMPFGEGPRICIGMRFAQMQIKTGLIHIFAKVQFSLPKELQGMKRIPLDKKSFLIAAEDGLMLTVSKRKKSSAS
ncbi:cytochrome P450 6k1-like [Hetaerina americana]|uniref:cytochrome P450 6k1-like n=1 Tax=Hetaerina americana TaxID=62018 RepID=UPI003A7F3C9F